MRWLPAQRGLRVLRPGHDAGRRGGAQRRRDVRQVPGPAVPRVSRVGCCCSCCRAAAVSGSCLVHIQPRRDRSRALLLLFCRRCGPTAGTCRECFERVSDSLGSDYNPSDPDWPVHRSPDGRCNKVGEVTDAERGCIAVAPMEGWCSRAPLAWDRVRASPGGPTLALAFLTAPLSCSASTTPCPAIARSAARMAAAAAAARGMP